LFAELIEYPPSGNVTTLYELLQRAICITENGDFIGEKDCNGIYQWIKYKQVADDSAKIGSALLKLGVKAGECSRVGLAGLTSARYIIAQYALISYSIVSVPLYHNYSMESLCQIIESCGLEVVFFDKFSRAKKFIDCINNGTLKTLKKIIVMEEEATLDIEPTASVQIYGWNKLLKIGEESRKPVTPPSPMSVFVICHTSGTTGKPKGVQLSHRALLASMTGLFTQWCVSPHNMHFSQQDVYISFLSMAHVYEQLMQAFLIYVGGRVGIFGGNIRNLLDDMQLLRPTIISLVPRLMNRFYEKIYSDVDSKSIIKRVIFHTAVKAKLQLLSKGNLMFNTIWDKIVFKKLQKAFGGNLRLITTGGAPISKLVMAFSRIAYGCPVFEGYGQTECSAAGTLSLPFDTASGHVGGPAVWAQVKLIDVDELGYKAADDIGEVCFKGAGLMSSYFNDPELTVKTVDEEGWLHTGDIGMWLPNGSLKIIDRRNNLFKLAQSDFISPEQIENVYIQHPFVKQILVYGTPLKSHLVGIVVVDENILRNDYGSKAKSTQSKCVTTLSTTAFLSDKSVRLHAVLELRKFGAEKGLTGIEQLKNAYLTVEEFTPESGLATPTLKMKRALLQKKYAAILDRLYKEELLP
uniref:long-chain-fatty-acid--CoA ligase n=1 Tax=Syphacia muris TaxID=451379 RepID=A0A0N5AKY3_9BILA